MDRIHLLEELALRDGKTMKSMVLSLICHTPLGEHVLRSAANFSTGTPDHSA